MFKEPATCDPHVLFSLHSVADRMCYIISPDTGIEKMCVFAILLFLCLQVHLLIVLLQ